MASSPLYQSMENAKQLGFEVRVFARVPDLGDGADRIEKDKARMGHGRSASNGNNSGTVIYGPTPVSSASGAEFPTLKNTRRRAGSASNTSPAVGSGRKYHSHKLSGGTSTESEGVVGSGGGAGGAFPQGFMRSLGSPLSAAVSVSLPSSSHSPFTSAASPGSGTPGGSNPPASGRVKYREQGVDELLQLKLHQVIAKVEGLPPAQSTIVLVTGDGNVGQFNDDGFLGSVRTALKKGWRVELYAWETGLSKSWKREFGEGSEWARTREGEEGPRFRIIGMEQFGSELVEVYY